MSVVHSAVQFTHYKLSYIVSGQYTMSFIFFFQLQTHVVDGMLLIRSRAAVPMQLKRTVLTPRACALRGSDRTSSTLIRHRNINCE